ncbi:response regulator [Thermomonospora cellulosilytica]|uniref:DNA-binding NarL/FixJ family response regulator n=1 Tax=Thermomonospora cellulosilytica TaxID=1411118 RepID=A0A7W3RBH1_9ACTN|nr:response regulator transcription factor [Thermomonospora cellulosilytica]MBA9006749.1 DNA-binding NarL/FixJ family response regulator [Thermomonospora cellulosilytica]
MTVDVLLVDDERLIRAGLRAIIDAEPDLRVVGEAADGSQVPGQVARLRPHVVLMDVRMPELDGIQATRTLLASADPPKVLVVTTFENDEYVYDALRVGASGFLLKRARPEEILQAIRIVAHGDTLLFPAAIRALAAEHGQGGGGGTADWHGRLTEREADVLRLMAKGHSNAEIARELFVSPQTVKTHVGNVLAKLHARDRTQAVIFAYETGFIAPR